MTSAIQIGNVWHPNYELEIDRFTHDLPPFLPLHPDVHLSLLNVVMCRDPHVPSVTNSRVKIRTGND